MINSIEEISLIRDPNSHKLSMLTELKNPICIDNYKYVCLQHYILKCMLHEYSKDEELHEDEKYHVFKILDDLRRNKTYTSFLNYYDKWLITPRYKDMALNYEYTIVNTASESQRWRNSMMSYYTNAYWLLFNHIKGSAVSLSSMSIIVNIKAELPHEKELEGKIEEIILSLRDRYIKYSNIPLIETLNESLVMYLLCDELYDIKELHTSGFTLVRRYVRSLIPIDEAPSYIIGMESHHCELIREYWSKVIDIDTSTYINIPLQAQLFIDLVDGCKGFGFIVISNNIASMKEDDEFRGYVLEYFIEEFNKYVV